MAKRKFCKDCKWFSEIKGLYYCESPMAIYNLITGARQTMPCEIARSNENKCGVSGKWFVKK